MNGYTFPKSKGYSVKRMTYRVDDFRGLNLTSDPNTLPLNFARNAYNVSFENGILSNGYGIRSGGFTGLGASKIRPLITLKPKKIWTWKVRTDGGQSMDKLLVLCGDASGSRKDKIYLVDLDAGTSLYSGVTLPEGGDAIGIRYTLKGENTYLFYKTTGGAYVAKNDFFEEHQNTPPLISVCSHYTRIFGIESGAATNRLLFSAAENPVNWNVSATEGGYIGVGNEEWGMLKVVKSFKGYVYIFSQHGIYRLTAYADQSSFKLEPVTSFCGNLRPNTVTDCGDRIVFITDEAMYSFDGFDTKRLISDNFTLISDSSAAATAWDGEKLFVSCAIKKDDLTIIDENKATAINNAVLIVDPVRNSAEIMRGADVEYFYFLEYLGTEKLMAVIRGKPTSFVYMEKGLGTYEGNQLKKRWATSVTDFLEPGKSKRLRRVHLRSKYNVTLNLILDGTAYPITVKGSEKWQSIYVNRLFDEMSLEFLLDVIPAATSSNVEINGFSLEVEFTRRYKDGL